ncbi:MAG: hypothetical protein LKJ64_03870 [Lentilactobacillus buchneri]|jgi:hypothetical protein|nr:hypothetical protein [Lentilactobacillus buchneri]MCI2019703.1 hypothetical protein [Lentilactobacillus buchneri]MCI2028121.1 hypothetical protein [Lentilactobacillus buchneri]
MSKKFVLNSVSLMFALSGVLLFSTVSVNADAGATAKQAGVVSAQKVKPAFNSSKVAETKNVKERSSQSVTNSKDNQQGTTYTYTLRKTPSKSTVANKCTLQNKKVRIAKTNSKKKNATYFKGHAKKAKSLNTKKGLKNTAKKTATKRVSKKTTNTSGSQTPVNTNTGDTTTNNKTTTTNTAPTTSTNNANTGSSSTPSTSTGTTDSNQTGSNNTTSFNPQSTKISTGSNAVNGQQTQQSQQATQEAKDAQLDKEAQSANTRLQPWYTGTAAAANVGELAYYVTGSVSNVVGQGTAIVGAVTNVISTIRNLF